MSYSKVGFTGAGAVATISRSLRNVYIDDCASATTPAASVAAGTTTAALTFDSARIARVLTNPGSGTSYYRTPTFTVGAYAAFEGLIERIGAVANGNIQIRCVNATTAAVVAYISLQADGNNVAYGTAAVGSVSTTGVNGAAGDRYKINFTLGPTSSDFIVRKNSFTDIGGSLSLNQIGYATTALPNGTLVFFDIYIDGTAAVGIYGIRTFDGVATYGADTLSSAVLQGAPPMIAGPQGTLQRRYTFDTDVQNWTTTGGSQSQTNGKLQVVGGGSTRCIALEPSSASNVADGEYYVDVYPTAGGSGLTGLDDVFIVFRATDTSNFYALELYLGNYSGASLPEVGLSKVVGGTFTTIVQDVPQASSTTQQIAQQFVSMPPNAAWPPLRVMVRFVGAAIQVYVNESHVLSAYDSSLTSGRVGVGTGVANGYTILADNASVYSLPSTWTPANYDTPAISGLQAWQTPTLLNGWVAYGSPYAPAAYYLGPEGKVHLRGLVKSGTPGSTIFTLPAGYRPETKLLVATVGSAGSGDVVMTVIINTDGTVVSNHSSANTYVTLDNISFRQFG